MADIAPDLVNPHEPSKECGDTHCYYHHVDESDAGAYRVCFECKHVYPTAEALQEAWAEVATPFGYALPREAHVAALPAEQIYACPLCAHDW